MGFNPLFCYKKILKILIYTCILALPFFLLFSTQNAQAGGLIYSTYIGGGGSEIGRKATVDEEGNFYHSGLTRSTNFPTTPGAADTTFNTGFANHYIVKLNPTGTQLVFATFIGPTSIDAFFTDIAIDAEKNVYLAGNTNLPTYPMVNSYDNTITINPFGVPSFEAVMVKLSPTGSQILYSTFVGSNRYDNLPGIAVLDAQNVYVAGKTENSSGLSFPVLAGDFRNEPDGREGMIVKLDTTKSGVDSFVFGILFGGNNIDEISQIALDKEENIYVGGQTRSTNFPTTEGAFDRSYNGGFFDAYVAKFSPNGTALIYSTYLGSSGPIPAQFNDNGLEQLQSLEVDSQGNAYVSGTTQSSNIDYPTTPGAFQTSQTALRMVFVTKLDPTGSHLVYSTLLGGSGFQDTFGMAVDRNGNAHVTGRTTSPNFPMTVGAFDTQFGGLFDAYLTKLNASGTKVVYSSFLGGSGIDVGNDLFVDEIGNVYVSGATRSTNFPVTAGAFDITHNGDFDLFATKLPVTPQAQIEFLRSQVLKLAGDNLLNEGQENSLNAKLDAALNDLSNNNASSAFNVMLAFINQMEAYIGSGRLSLADGQPLIECAINVGHAIINEYVEPKRAQQNPDWDAEIIEGLFDFQSEEQPVE